MPTSLRRHDAVAERLLDRRRTWEGETLTGAQWKARDVAVRRTLTDMSSRTRSIC